MVNETFKKYPVIVFVSYRVCSKDVQVWFVSLQQQSECTEETLNQQVDALTTAGQQQLLHRLHRYTNISDNNTTDGGWETPVRLIQTRL